MYIEKKKTFYWVKSWAAVEQLCWRSPLFKLYSLIDSVWTETSQKPFHVLKNLGNVLFCKICGSWRCKGQFKNPLEKIRKPNSLYSKGASSLFESLQHTIIEQRYNASKIAFHMKIPSFILFLVKNMIGVFKRISN